MAVPDRHGRGAAWRRQRQRPDRARRHGAGRQAARPDLRHREPPRRRRHDRRQPSDQGRPGRHYDPGLWGAGERARALFEAALRHAERSHTGPPARPTAAGRRDRAVQVQDPRRPGGCGQGQAGRAELFDGGRRLGIAFRRRTHSRQRGLQGAAHSVQGRRRSGDRGRRRADRFQRAVVLDDYFAAARRQACGACGQRGEARLCHAGGADHHRSRPAAQLGLSVLQRALPAGEHATRHR